MKRVLSVRIENKTIAQCYDIIENAGATNRISLSAAITVALDFILAGLESVGEVRHYTEEQAAQRISAILGPINTWPGRDALKERPLLKVPNFSALVTKKEEPQEVDTSKPDLVGRRKALEERIAEVMAESERSTDEELKNLVSIETDKASGVAPSSNYTETPFTKAIAPWEGVPMIASDDVTLAKDRFWNELLGSTNRDIPGGEDKDLIMLATRIVYNFLNRTDWSTDTAIRLILETYEKFLAYKQKNNFA